MREAYGRLPLSFEANRGQTDARVAFLARGPGYTLFLTPAGAMLALRRPSASGADVADAPAPVGAALRLQLLGANPTPELSGFDELPGKVNYFLGSDSASWRADIPTYARVRYREIYPGVDLVDHGNQGQLEYDFILAPGADPGVIRLDFAGTEDKAIDARGDLVLGIAGGEVRQRRPLGYQDVAGARQEVAVRYALRGEGQVSLEAGPYDSGRPLVINSTLAYSTFLGGTGRDQGSAIAVDATGSAYVTGTTESAHFPTTDGAFTTSFNGGHDVFVAKLDPTGSALAYSTFLGTSEGDWGSGVAVDGAGHAYVTGMTWGADFPTTPDAFSSSLNGRRDAFVTKLNPTGSALAYSTFLGGTSLDEGSGIAVDGAGSAYVTGSTLSADFPTTPGAFATTHNGGAFVTKLDPTGSALAYSTFLRSTGRDQGSAIAVDATGSAYVTGTTRSADFPTTPGAFDTSFNGNYDVFVAKLGLDGSALAYSTFLGSSSDDYGNGIAVDGAGSAYVTGMTYGAGFQTTAGAFDTSFEGRDAEAFVTKLDPTGSALAYSTFIGGTNQDSGHHQVAGHGIAVDGAGSAYVAGTTESADFPTTPGAFDTTHNGGSDIFVAKLDSAGSALAYSTFLGGRGNDYGPGIAVDGAGSAYVTGITGSAAFPSTDFPTTAWAFDTSFNGDSDAFVTKLNLAAGPAALTLAPAGQRRRRRALADGPANDPRVAV
jgi:hypothetical protein